MTSQRHGSTDAPVEGFEATLQRGFEWITNHPREVLATLVGFLLVAGIATAVYELRSRGESEAQEALARAERSFAERLGGDPKLALIPEPANPDQARKVREESLAELDRVAADHTGTRAADFARLRAAEIAVDLGDAAGAKQRLDALAADLGMDDPVRGVVLRLRGYVDAQAGEFLSAAETYARAAAVESYPDRASVWVEAARNFERARDFARAGDAYAEAIAADPEFAEAQGLADRLAAARAAAALAPGAPAAPPPGAPESGS
jgi:tetratricopeptide (TPR) repeat protein